MFDYVRFPSDGDVDSAVYQNRGALSKREAIPAFLRYAPRRLERHGVRISAAVFGLSASRDLGIGRLPRRMAPHLDGLYAMTYPSLFAQGEARDRGTERGPRRDRRASVAAICDQASGHACSRRPVGAGLLPRHPSSSSRFEPRSTRPAGRERRASCSGTQRACTRTARWLRPELTVREPVARDASLARADVANAVVEPALPMRPELDALGQKAVAAPERRQRYFRAPESLLDLGDAGCEVGSVGDWLRLGRRPPGDPAGSRPAAPVCGRVGLSHLDHRSSTRTWRPSSHQWKTAAARDSPRVHDLFATLDS